MSRPRATRAAGPTPAGIRPLIEIAGDLAQMSDNAWRVLERVNHPPRLFRYGSAIARVENDERELPTIRVLNQDGMRHELARLGRWIRRTSEKNRDRLQDVHPPMDVVRDMLANPTPPLPSLQRIVLAPTFANNGSLQLEPGYSSLTQTVYAARGLALPALPVHPTSADVDRAVELIRDVTCDFPFAHACELAHAVALLVLPFVQPLIDGPLPLTIIDKPGPGAGAGLLADVLLSPSLGRVPPKMTEGGDEAEWRKRITSTYLSGTQVIVVDNVHRTLDSAALASALTEDWWSDRLLGHSRNVELPSRRVWVATGNNVQLSNEIRRRAVRIRLDPGVERPESRTEFRHPQLMQYVADHRGQFVWSVLVMVRAWLAAGKPEGTRLLPRFEAWSRVVGGILDVVGVPGLLGNRDDMENAMDASTMAWAEFVSLWWSYHGSGEVTIQDLWPVVQSHDALLEGLDLGAGNEQSQRTRLGTQIRRHRDRIFSGRRICAAGHLHGGRRWRLTEL